ncbi:phage holin family protein [Paracoccus sp. CPCC 101403]|uniref:Phage holin family protein n=1 Tax=Paracoccus broussonetiae TaxID=3075834 RepID=A0ABU3EGK2_9RHOB|nr:phage holin family protein [Paracoccus sp. CPCC 101403]MDT1063371.1 phage holin family protein [Paracoccus sp. CPCC 101403]
MFAYTRNMQLALSDKVRRTGLVAGAGVLLILGGGFLLAALWTYLAHHLGWGSMAASIAIGGVLFAVGILVLLIARVERHPVPTTDELKSEVEQQLNLLANTALERASTAADEALDRASAKATAVLDLAEQKVHSVTDDLGYRANRAADQAEARLYGAARRAGETTARRMGFGAMNGSSDRPGSRAGTIAPLLGALAVGVTLAGRFQDWRHRDEDPD